MNQYLTELARVLARKDIKTALISQHKTGQNDVEQRIWQQIKPDYKFTAL